MTAGLTRAQKHLKKEAEEIATLAHVDIWRVEEQDPKHRLMVLRIAIQRLVVAEVVTKYTLLDEILSDIICKFLFKQPNKKFHFGKLWKTKKFSTFVRYMLDDMYLLQKMRLVHAIKTLPPEVRQSIEKINAVRNALAHSFFPENRREYFKRKK